MVKSLVFAWVALAECDHSLPKLNWSHPAGAPHKIQAIYPRARCSRMIRIFLHCRLGWKDCRNSFKENEVVQNALVGCSETSKEDPCHASSIVDYCNHSFPIVVR